MWYTLVCVFLNYITLTNATENGAVFIHPQGDIYVRYGSPLEMYCATTGNYTAKDLIVTLSGITIPTEVYNETTIRLYIERPERRERIPYYCKNNKTKAIALASVVVASPPANVSDFKCLSKNFEVLNCSWTTNDRIIFTNYSVSLLSKGKRTIPECYAVSVPDSFTRYCVWTSSTRPLYRQQEKTFDFELVGVNDFGTIKQIFSIDHFSNVKPDPPMNLVNVSATAHSVFLQWIVPNNIADFLRGEIEHKIEYQIAKIDSPSVFRTVNITTELVDVNNEHKMYTFSLTGLPYAHMQYGVRICIKCSADKRGQHWSDFKHIDVYTASEIPSRPPELPAGAFIQNIFDKYRKIHIYWKQLEEYEEAGADFTYNIVVKYGSHKSETLYPDSNKGLGFLVLNNASLQAINIYVSSYNEIGSSIDSSHLYIPPVKDTYFYDINSLTKLAYGNGTYELTWPHSTYRLTSGNSIDNYTLFWCEHNITGLCNGRINYTILGREKNKHVIDLQRDHRFQFAISANKGSKSSGMIWAKCDISKDEIEIYQFPILFTGHDAPGATPVKETWPEPALPTEKSTSIENS